jgi:putative ABC transport system permease protein
MVKDADGEEYAEVIYGEDPPYNEFAKLEGVAEAAKVLVKDNAFIHVDAVGEYVNGVRLMSVRPADFGRSAWFRPDLLPQHWYRYLNLLAKQRDGFLLSEPFRQRYGVKTGDKFRIEWRNGKMLFGRALGFFEYWPGYNPLAGSRPLFEVVGNLDYVQTVVRREPWQVWVVPKPGFDPKRFEGLIRDKGLSTSRISIAAARIETARADSALRGTNGFLTLNFLIVMLICAAGFFIYWMLSMRQRTLSFGIIRALGLSRNGIVRMLAWEQLLTFGAALVSGILVSGIASDLFIRLLEVTYIAAEQVPPIMVRSDGGDYLKIYLIVAFMFIAGNVGLAMAISRLKVTQALKLGED